MCIIIVKNKGVEVPSMKTLKYCEKLNPHGFGMAWAGKDSVHIRKGFDHLKEMDVLSNKVGKDSDIIYHFRQASSGAICKELRHPFPITQNKDIMKALNVKCDFAMAHNGHIAKLDKHKGASDTMMLIKTILQPLWRERNIPAMRELLESYIGWGKLAIISTKGIETVGSFVKDKDTLLEFSNSNYKETHLAGDDRKSWKNWNGGNDGKWKKGKDGAWSLQKCAKGVTVVGTSSDLPVHYQPQTPVHPIARMEYTSCQRCGQIIPSNAMYYVDEAGVCWNCYCLSWDK